MQQIKSSRWVVASFVLGVILTALVFTFVPFLNGNLKHTDITQNLVVPVNRNTGIVFIAPKTGTYTFEYIDSAYAPGDGNWSTIIVAFTGDQPLWIGEDLDYSQSLFVFGSGGHPSRKDAITEATGQTVIVNLTAGDHIVLVAGDNKSTYGENSGDIRFRIKYTP